MAINRLLEPAITYALKSSRVVAITGARQVGKSTLAAKLPGGRGYFTMDDIGVRDAAKRDPVGFARGLPHGSVIDEAQLVPELFRAVKLIVDQRRVAGQFVLTGSSNISTMPHLSESLAGRVAIFTLRPFAQYEVAGKRGSVVEDLFDTAHRWDVEPVDQTNLIERLTAGGYPEACDSSSVRARDLWFSNYINTMMQRDIRDLAQIADTAAIYRLLADVTSRSGQIRNITKIASTTEIAAKTVERYMNTLEQAHLISTIPAWRAGIPGRKSAAPKVVANDSGLAAFQLHADFDRLSKDRNLLGPLLETFVINEVLKHASWSDEPPNLLHYREKDAVEVDILLENRRRECIAIEVKATSSPTERDFRGLYHILADERLNVVQGVLVYTGSTIIPRNERLKAIPVSMFWS